MRTKNSLVFVLTVGMIVQAFPRAEAMPAALAVQQIDPTGTYRLTNDYAGPGKSLAVESRNGDLEVTMAVSKNEDPFQRWKLVPLGGDKYRLTNLGSGTDKSVDTPKSGDQYQIRMRASGGYTGQFWTLSPVGGGKYRLTNDYGTPALSLDTPLSGSQHIVVLAGTGNYSGQMWTLTRVDAPATQPMFGPVITSASGRPAPAVVTGIPATPTTTTSASSSKGEALCVKGGSVGCGLAKAYWVGTHTLNMNCSRGFFDPIWGGTCWEAPPTNDRGAWIRSLTPITKPDAFWRIPSEKFAEAVFVRKQTFAWDCPTDTFWDGYNGGGCYKCPSDYPRRTAYSISDSKACATSADKQEASAVFVKYNACSAPDARSMNLPGKMTPGRPFLEVGSGCYACPTTDEEGNILITERNLKPVAGGDYENNTGCTILMKWKPAQFVEPGMAGIPGVSAAIDESLAFSSHEILTFYFQEIAKGKGYAVGSPQSKQLIAQRWSDVANDPVKSLGVTTLMYTYLELAIQKEPSSRTAAEKAFVNGFSEYVTRRRTFIAEQALAMYDAWKAAEPQLRATVAQSQLMTMLYYGTVPLDFQSAAAAGLGLTSAGLGTAGALAAELTHAAGTLRLANDARQAALAARQAAGAATDTAKAATAIQNAVSAAVRTQNVGSAMSSLSNFRLLAVGSQIGLVAGPLAISIAGSILMSIAIDQAIEIATARDKLTNAVEIAKQPADLKALLALADGRDQLGYFWSRAIGGTSPLDAEIRRVASTVAAHAREANYEIPAPVTASPNPVVSTTGPLPLGSALLQEYRAATSGISVQPSTSAFNGIWGLKPTNEVMRTSRPGEWGTIPGILTQIAAGFDGSVFGVNPSQQVWQWTGSAWKQLPGGLKKVAVQSASRIAGVNEGGEAWTFDGTTWSGIPTPMKMKDIAIGNDGYLFAIGQQDQIFRSSAPVARLGSPGWTWEQMPGGGSKIVAVNKDLALTINAGNELWIWKSGGWAMIGTNVSEAAVSKDTIWSLSSDHRLLRLDASGWVVVTSPGLNRFAVPWNAPVFP